MGNMTLLRVIARPMLASMFVSGGASALQDPGRRVERAEPVAEAIRKVAPNAPISAATLVRANAVVHLLGGIALATGRAPRLSALALAATMPPTTAMGHQFWNETDPAQRQNQKVHFLKNVAMTGGLLMSTLDPDPHKKFIGRRAKDRVVEAGDAVASRFSRS